MHQHGTKNAPTWHQECANFAPRRMHQECANFAPRMHQLCTKNAPTLNAPTLHQECTNFAPRMPTFSPRMLQKCTNFAPTLSNMEATKHENTEKNTRRNIHHKGAKNLLYLVNTIFTKQVNVLKPFLSLVKSFGKSKKHSKSLP